MYKRQLNRSVTIQGTNSTNTMSLIQMDASVSPGNSGGGLFNMNGELVGIVNAKSSSSDAAVSYTHLVRPCAKNARSPICAPPVLRALHWSCPTKQRPSPADCSL